MDIVDSLIVTLGLDTRKFTEGQKRATDALGKMKAESETSAKSVEGHWNKAKTILEAIGRPVETAQQHLRNLSTQSARTGAAVRAGALAGSEGLLEMAASASLLLIPLAAIGKLTEMTLKAAPATATFGRTATNMGEPVGWLSSYVNAAQITAGANPAAVTGELGAFEQGLVNARMTPGGAHSPQMIALGWLRIATQDAHRNPLPLDKILPQIQAKLHAMSGPDRTYWANRLGLGSLNNTFGAVSEAQFARTLAEAKLTAMTKGEVSAAQKLVTAEGGVETAFNSLALQLEELDSWVLTPLMNRLVPLIRDVDRWLHVNMHKPGTPGAPVRSIPDILTGKGLADAALADHAARAKTSAEVQARQGAMMAQLQAAGWSRAAAAAWVGNAMAESSMNPRAANGDHTGLWGLSPTWRAKIKALTGIDMNTAGQADQVRGMTAAIQKYEPALYARLRHEPTGVAATDILNTFEKPYTGAREYIEGIRRSVYAYRAAALPGGGAQVANAPWLPGFHASLRAATIGAGGADASLHYEMPGSGLTGFIAATNRSQIAKHLAAMPPGHSLTSVMAALRAKQGAVHNATTTVHLGPVVVHAKSADAKGIGHETAAAIKRAFLAAQANTGLA